MTKKSFLSPQNQVSDLSSGQVGLDLELFRFPEMQFLPLPGGISGGTEQERGGGGDSLMEHLQCWELYWGSFLLQKVAFDFMHEQTGVEVKPVSWDS